MPSALPKEQVRSYRPTASSLSFESALKMLKRGTATLMTRMAKARMTDATRRRGRPNQNDALGGTLRTRYSKVSGLVPKRLDTRRNRTHRTRDVQSLLMAATHTSAADTRR